MLHDETHPLLLTHAVRTYGKEERSGDFTSEDRLKDGRGGVYVIPVCLILRKATEKQIDTEAKGNTEEHRGDLENFRTRGPSLFPRSRQRKVD